MYARLRKNTIGAPFPDIMSFRQPGTVEHTHSQSVQNCTDSGVSMKYRILVENADFIGRFVPADILETSLEGELG
jgi:hypothetical protein